MDGCDTLTLLEVALATYHVGELGLESQRSRYVFSMVHAKCKVFGVVTYGMHMAVYGQQKGDTGMDANAMREWVPQHTATKSCVAFTMSISLFVLPFFSHSRSLA